MSQCLPPLHWEGYAESRREIYPLSSLPPPSPAVEQYLTLTLNPFLYQFLNLIMTHGRDQPNESTSTVENINESRDKDNSSQTADTTVNSPAEEERARIFERIEQEMDVFRKGEYTRFQASTRVANELGKWAGASDKEKGKAFDSYLAEINSVLAIQDEDQSAT